MKLKIKGLDCANCAMSVEDELKKDKRLDKVVVDFAGQSISFDMLEQVDLDEIKKTVIEVEPDISFIEGGVKTHKYYISGLDCANCAAEFEVKLNKRPEITNAIVDFAQQKLVVEYDEKDFRVIQDVARDMEDDISVEKNKVEESKSGINYEIIASVSIAVVLLLISFLVPMSEGVKTVVIFIAYIIAGYDVLIKLVKNLLKGQLFDENFLMGIATVAAFGIGEHVEAVAVMLFYKVGEFFQELAVNNSRRSISGLMDIKAEYANLVTQDGYEQVDPNDIKIGDKILVKPGEKVPLDGKIIDGSSYLDTKALTGESKVTKVEVGNDVLSGSINTDGVITIEVEKEFSDSTVAKILDLVENSSANKAPTENFITKFARVYTPTVVVIAAIIAFLPPLILNQDFNPWIYKALIFLVISCPCALVISVPLGFFGGIGNASKNGILIKGANYLEALNDLETVVFDKTGTLTKGDFAVVDIVTENGYTKEELLEYAAYAEQYSNHPIAVSIKDKYQKEIDFSRLNDYQEVSGQGIQVKLDDELILAGNHLLMDNNGIKYSKTSSVGTIVCVAKGKDFVGYIEVADQIKEDTIKGLKDLKDIGIKNLIMLTGDNEVVAKDVAQKTGITKYFAKLLPSDKVEKFEELEKSRTLNKKIAFVGDGINDAPVLARADVGIAMGGVGSDAAIESADMIIMNDEISKIAKSVKIAKRTRRIVKQNITLAIVVKLIALLLGLFGMAQIWEAIIADVGVAIIAIFNAMRVLNDKK